MLNEWDTVVKGIKGMVSFLEDESIFDAQRLPSYTAIPILAALWEHLPTQPDKLGNARYLTAQIPLAGFPDLALRAVFNIQCSAGLPRIAKGSLRR